MIQVLPFLAWLATITSGVVLAVLWFSGASPARTRVPLSIWFLLAVYLQFFGRSPIQSAVGLALQTILAIVLVLRLRLGD